MELLSVFISWLRPAFRSRGMTIYLVLSAFTSRIVSLLGTTKASLLFSIVCTLPNNILSSSAWTKSWCVTFYIRPFWFTWTFPVAYSKTKLKSNGDKVSPFFETFLTENMSDQCLPTRTCHRFRHIFINLTSFMWIPNSVRILLLSN